MGEEHPRRHRTVKDIEELELRCYARPMLIRVDLQAGVPVYEQVAGAIAAKIAGGELLAGERLPAARDLADALGVNAHTILHAYQALRDQGLIELRRGRGAVVIGAAGSDPLHEAVAALIALAKRDGVAPAALHALIRKDYPA